LVGWYGTRVPLRMGTMPGICGRVLRTAAPCSTDVQPSGRVARLGGPGCVPPFEHEDRRVVAETVFLGVQDRLDEAPQCLRRQLA
jgi:hypothetical protein